MENDCSDSTGDWIVVVVTKLLLLTFRLLVEYGDEGDSLDNTEGDGVLLGDCEFENNVFVMEVVADDVVTGVEAGSACCSGGWWSSVVVVPPSRPG